MGFFSDDSPQAQNYQDVNNPDNQGSFTHEMIAGAAAFGADKAYNDHCDANGQPVSHQMAKELMSGFAGAEVDRLAETKGADFIDRERASRDAASQAHQGLNPDDFNNNGGQQQDQQHAQDDQSNY